MPRRRRPCRAVPVHTTKPKRCVSGQSEIIYIYHFCRFNVRAHETVRICMFVSCHWNVNGIILSHRVWFRLGACMPYASSIHTHTHQSIWQLYYCVSDEWQRFHFGTRNMTAPNITTQAVPENHYATEIILCEQFTALLVYWPQSAKH